MNRAKFQKSLQALTGWRERAFMLALAERALPNAELYFDGIEYVPLDPNVFPFGLESLICQSWQSLILEPEEEQIVEMLDLVTSMLPEESEHYGALPTRDCLQVWEQALLAGVNEEKKRAIEASQLSLETVTSFIEFSEGEGKSENQLIKLFDSHPLVEREFSFQSELSDVLRSAKHPSKETIEGVRELAQDEGVSNIGISLDESC